MALAVLDAEAVRARLPFHRLIPALHAAFAADEEAPARQHLHVPGTETTLLLMPAWTSAETIGVKLVNVAPGNAAIGLPSIQAVYLLADAATGRWLALLDGNELTALRTAAVAALAASLLSRPDAETMLVVGSGRVARLLPDAYRAVRPRLRRFAIWNVNPGGAEKLAQDLRQRGFEAAHAPDLEAAVRQADIVSCATLSRAPLIQGAWLKAGAHLDLIGSFSPATRESDDAAVLRARVFVDSIEAREQSGDLVHGLASGVIARAHILGRLSDLCRGDATGRRGADDITLFKSVGTALADLAAARLVHDDGRRTPVEA